MQIGHAICSEDRQWGVGGGASEEHKATRRRPGQSDDLWCPERLQPQWVLPDPPGPKPRPGPRRRFNQNRWRTATDGRRWPAKSIPSTDDLRRRGGPYNAAEACRITGLHDEALRSHRERGRVAVLHVRGRYFYDKAALDDLLAGHRLSPARLTTHQAAQHLGITPNQLERLVTGADIEIRQNKRDNSIWLSTIELDRYIQRCRINPTPNGDTNQTRRPSFRKPTPPA